MIRYDMVCYYMTCYDMEVMTWDKWDRNKSAVRPEISNISNQSSIHQAKPCVHGMGSLNFWLNTLSRSFVCSFRFVLTTAMS